MRSSRLRAAFVAASVTWAALLLLVPFLASRTHASALGTAVVVFGYSIGRLICHQLPERSYHLWTAQMPVCARCAGIYFGAAAAAVVAYACSIHSVVGHRFSGAAAGRARIILFAAAVPTILTLLYEWMTGVTPANPVRAAAGIPIGAAVAWLVVAATRAGGPERIR